MRRGWLHKLLHGSPPRPSAAEPRRCAHCGYEVSGAGVQPSSCPQCGQVLRISA